MPVHEAGSTELGMFCGWFRNHHWRLWGPVLHFLFVSLCFWNSSVCLYSPEWKQDYISCHFLYEKLNKVETKYIWP